MQIFLGVYDTDIVISDILFGSILETESHVYILSSVSPPASLLATANHPLQPGLAADSKILGINASLLSTK